MFVLKTNQETYAQGETVKITLILCNDTAAVQEYEFPTGQQFDVFVERGANEVWRWSEGQFFMQAFTTVTLQPGECKMFEVEWNQLDSTGQQVQPGVYTVRGVIKGTELEAATTIRII